MGKFIFLMSLTIALSASAAGSKAKVPKIYLDAKGQRIEITDALLSSMHGELVYQCTEVAAQVSKAGSSIALKHKK